MRKLQKQEIVSIIATLYEAHEEIKNIIADGNYATAQGLLAQCQECAVGIGNAIEKSEGEGILTISYIEEYCDALYHAYEELGGEDGANAGKIYKSLRKSLLRVENSVRNDVPVRKEIVFFPYKASMWDSLESVYLKVQEDPTCDAYCVPIPYYDVNPDGSLGQMHYEGGEYPKNIEIIDWEKYDFENIKPDVAYIHNPYDDCNLVTRVHSRFYASNLKKYVGELIYIPYFVLREIEPDDQNAIDSMKHFIWLPGVVHADKVIVQSEKMAQIYRNEFRKAAIANGLPEKYTSKAALEKKILGLGSPKIEKVKNTKKEDLEIPQEWQKIINKSDGSRKKIVFYNTSVGALLANNEKMLEKMKDVFRIFKENKDEIALLWRPHPLIENTVKAMRPQLWGEYKKIVDQYKTEGWGIYDDTADMDRAVVLSDAYYGDGSSVVQLYQQTGKPMMLQNPCVSENGYPNFIFCSYRCSICNGKLVLTSTVTNLVLVVSANEKETMRYFEFENEKYDEYLYLATDVVENSLYAAPYNAKEFRVINLSTGKQETIGGVLNDEEKEVKQKFLQIIPSKGVIWCIGENISKIIAIDITKERVVKSVDASALEKEYGIEKGNVRWSYGHVIYKNKILIPSRNANCILEICLDTQDVNFYPLENDNFQQGFSDIYIYEENLSVMNQDGVEFVLNSDYGVKKRREMPVEVRRQGIWKCVIEGRNRIIFAFRKAEIFVVNNALNSERIDVQYVRDVDLPKDMASFQYILHNEDQVYFQCRKNGDTYVLELETRKCSLLEMNWNVERVETVIQSHISHQISVYSIINENNAISLARWIRYIVKII